MDEFAQLLAQLSPEERAQLMRSGSLADQQADLSHQLAMVRELRGAPSQQHKTMGGGIAGAIGDILGAAGGAYKENKLMDQQAALRGQQADAQTQYANLIAQALRAQQSQQPPPGNGEAGAGMTAPQMVGPEGLPGQGVMAPQALPPGAQAKHRADPTMEELLLAQALPAYLRRGNEGV